MRAIVCGGRDYDDRDHIWASLDHIDAFRRIEIVIHGDARNCDRIAGAWARARSRDEKAVPAPWREWGKAAGVMRNTKMLTEERPDVVIAFPGGPGTADMVRKALKAGVEVIEIPARH